MPGLTSADVTTAGQSGRKSTALRHYTDAAGIHKQLRARVFDASPKLELQQRLLPLLFDCFTFGSETPVRKYRLDRTTPSMVWVLQRPLRQT